MPDRDLVGFVHNPRVPEAAALVESLVRSLKLRDTSWVASAGDLQQSRETLAATSTIITAGGDGTILRTVQVAAPYSIPVLGINMGRVGFMTELTVDEAAKRIPAYLNESPRVEQRMMLQASLTSDGETAGTNVSALNDVVVSRNPGEGLIDIALTINGEPLTTYRADGVIVATATGSTGYAMAAGGPVVYPEARTVLVQPVAPHLSLRSGLLLPDDSVLELRVSGEREAVFSYDAFTGPALGADNRVVIKVSPHVARFLRAGPPEALYATIARRLGASSVRVPERHAL